MRRLIFLLALGISSFIGAFMGPRDFYNGRYVDKDGKLVLIINSDNTGVCTANSSGLPAGEFRWRLLTEDSNKLLVTFANHDEQTLWLGSEAISGGHTYLSGKDNILFVIDDQENITAWAGHKQEEDPSVAINRAQISE